MNADIHTLTGAYATDALSDIERATFEHHLADCAACAAEVAELQATAALLGSTVSTAPPARLKPNVLAEVRQVRQLPPRVTELAAERREGTRRRWQVWAAAACFLAAVVFGVQAWSANQQAQQAQQQLDEVTSVLAAPDARVATASVGGLNATAIVSHNLGKVVFLARGMPALPSDRRYQLWLIGAPGGPHSPGLLSPGADPPPLVGTLARGQTRIGVTVEPVSGSAFPTSAPIIQFELPA